MPLGMDTSSQPCYDSELLHYERKRMKKFELKPPKISRNSADGFNALQCLQQLYDAELVNELLWEYQTPSNTQYSSEYPDFYEEVKVSISIMDDNPLSLSQDRNPKLYSRKVCSEAHSGIYHNGRTLQARG
jgi:hypothetical protein